MTMWAVNNTWYEEPTECEVWWGLFRISTKSTIGHVIGYVIAGLPAIFSGIALGFAGFEVFEYCSREYQTARPSPPREEGIEIMFNKSNTACRAWAGVSITLYIVCIIGVEVTLWMHEAEYASLGDKDLGQWIGLANGIATILSVGTRPLIRKLFKSRRANSVQDQDGSQSSHGSESSDDRLDMGDGSATYRRINDVESQAPSSESSTQSSIEEDTVSAEDESSAETEDEHTPDSPILIQGDLREQ